MIHHRRLGFIFLLGLAIVSLTSWIVSHQESEASSGFITKIVADGDLLPGGGAFGSTYLTSNQVALVNDSGDVAMGVWTSLEGRVVVARSVGPGFQLVKVEAAGDQAPGGGTVCCAGLKTSINSSGQVTYIPTVQQGDAYNLGVFLANPSGDAYASSRVVIAGDPAPVGGTFSNTGSWQGAEVNDLGHVVFSAPVDGGSSPAGLFIGSPQGQGWNIEKVVAYGDPAPRGGTFADTQLKGLDSSGNVYALASTSSGDVGVFRAVKTTGTFSVQEVVGTGDSLPGQVFVQLIRGFDANPQGEIVFVTSVVNSQGVGLGIRLYVGNWNGVSYDFTQVAVEGGTISDQPALSSSGAIAMTDGTSVSLALPGASLRPIVVAGDAHPLGGSFSCFGRNLSVNASNWVTFVGYGTPCGSGSVGIFMWRDTLPTAAPTPTSSATPTPTPISTPTPTPTAAPPTPTPCAECTPTPKASASITPTIGPSGTTPSSSQPPQMKGDFDCNGVVDPKDMLVSLVVQAGLIPDLPEGCDATGGSLDLDCNGSSDPRDILTIGRFLAGLPPDLPAGCAPLVSTPTPTPSPTSPAGYSFNLPPFYADPDQFQATVSSVQLVQSIPGSGFYDTVNAPPGADYFVVSMSVKNYGSTADSVSTFSFRFKDNAGRVFTIDFHDYSNVNSTAQSYFGKQGLYDTIQPGLTIQMVFVFLVPDGKTGLTGERCPNNGCDASILEGVAPGGCSFTIPPFYADPEQFCAKNVTLNKEPSIPGSGSYDPVTAPAGSKYAVVQMTASNYGYIPNRISSFSFRLRDSQNRLYTIDFEDDSNVNSTAQSYYGRRGLYNTLQPELTDSLVFVFLVPDGANGLVGEECPSSGCN